MQAVSFHGGMMAVHLSDGTRFGVPLARFPRLYGATPAQREQYRIGPRGLSLHWEEIDEDIYVPNLALAPSDLLVYKEA